MGDRFLILLLFIQIFCSVLSLNIGLDQSQYTPVPVVIFKLPRSGSTWFTEVINNNITVMISICNRYGRVPNVFISKEIMQGGDVGKYSKDTIEQHFAMALRVPSDKLSHSNNPQLQSQSPISSSSSSSLSSNIFPQHFPMLPSSRYMEDYVYSGKAMSKLHAVGFSINVEHCSDIDWSNVFWSPRIDQQLQQKNSKLGVVPATGPIYPRAIIYYRNNVVKAAISGYFGKLTKLYCGSSNLRSGGGSVAVDTATMNKNSVLNKNSRTNTGITSGSSLGENLALVNYCSGREDLTDAIPMLKWTPEEFCHEFNRWQSRQNKFFDDVKRIINIAAETISKQSDRKGSVEVAYVAYEDMQHNSSGVMKNLLLNKDFIQVPADSETARYLLNMEAENSSNQKSAKKSTKSQWKKRTAEDLRRVLQHFDEIEEKLRGHESCRAIHRQLTSVAVLAPNIKEFPSKSEVISDCKAEQWICQ